MRGGRGREGEIVWGRGGSWEEIIEGRKGPRGRGSFVVVVVVFVVLLGFFFGGGGGRVV